MNEGDRPFRGEEIMEKVEADWGVEGARRMDVLKTAVKAFLDAGDRECAERAEWERIAFAFRPTGQSVRGRWYGPIFEGRDGAGREVSWPRREDLDAPALEHLRDRALSSGNPHVQARFADLLWEFGDPADPGMARRAIAAYLSLVCHHLAHDVEDRALDISRNHLRRAAVLASQLNDQQLLAETIAAHREAFQEILQRMGQPIVPCVDILRSMMEFRGVVADAEVEERIGALEAWAGAHPDDTNSLLQEAILNLRIDWCQLRKDHDAAHRHRLEIARFREREGDETVERSPMVAQTFLLKAHRLYADLGAAEDAARVKAKLQAIGPKTLGEMKQVETSVDIPREAIEQIANVLRQYSAQDALRLIAGHRWWIPKVGEAKQYLEEAKKKYPLQFLVPKILVDADGNAHQLAQGEERDRHDLFEHLAMGLFASARLSMREAFRVLVEELKGTTDDLLTVIAQAQWLDRGRLPLLREAFDDYLAARFISACHILIPQLEGALRDMAETAGITAVGVRGRRMVPQTMDVLLKEPLLRRGLGEDLATTLEALLTDEVGQRIRHVVVHGNVTNAGFFGPELTEVLIYLLLQLASYRLRPGQAGGNPDLAEEQVTGSSHLPE